MPMNTLVKKMESKPRKSFLSPTSMGGSDYTINPYYGCTHGCVYCYAKTMLANQDSRTWGHFVGKYVFPNFNIKKGTGASKVIFSSMTDAYQIAEAKEGQTRKILEAIYESDLSISILTKSDLVTRDIDLFQKMKQVEVGFSISFLDDLSKRLEPGAPVSSLRIAALKKLHEAGIKTYVFVSPIIPYYSEAVRIIEEVYPYVDYMMFDTINLKDPENRKFVFQQLELIDEYRFHQLFDESLSYQKAYLSLKKEIHEACEKYHVKVNYIE